MSTPITPLPVSPDDQAIHDSIAQYTAQQLQSQNNRLQANIAAAAEKNPDLTAQAQQLGLQVGVGPDIASRNMDTVRKMALVQDVGNQNLPQAAPRLAKLLEDPNFSGVAYDDLGNLSRIEQGAATVRKSGLLAEAQSFGANINTAFFNAFKPLIDAVGVAGQGSLETGEALIDKTMGADETPLLQSLHDIWVAPRTFAVQKLTGSIQDYLSAAVQRGQQEYVQDPATGGVVKNPEYRWWGRGLVNAVEQVPGSLAAFALTGKAGGVVGADAGAADAEGMVGAVSTGAAVERKLVPALLSTDAAQQTYADARAKGVDQKTAVTSAIAAAMSNWAFMGEMPEPVPASTLGGAVGQWAGRSAAFGVGMGVSQNALTQRYDPSRGLFEGLPESVATMAAFEGAGAFGNTMGDIVDAVKDSKLRTRSPQAFQQAMNAMFEGDESLRIPSQDFVNYFTEKKIDPAAMAHQVGVTNLDEAIAAGSDLEIPKAGFTAKLDPEHQQGLLPDIIDPATGRTSRQTETSKAELQDWLKNGGVEKLQAEYAQADAETQATPEWQSVHDELKGRYVGAGETEPAAESYATLHANAIANLARKAGLKPDELLRMHNPDVVAGEAPPALYQSGVEGEGGVIDDAHLRAAAPKLVLDKLETSKDAIASFSTRADEWNLLPGIRAAVARLGNVEREGEPANPVIDALAKTLDGDPKAAKKAFAGYAHDATENESGRASTTNDAFDAFNRAFGSKLTPEEYHDGIEKAAQRQNTAADGSVSQPAAGSEGARGGEPGGEARPGAAGSEPESRSRSGAGERPAADELAAHDAGPVGKRGWFRMLPDGRYEIGKTKIGDFSTFIHEPAHAYLEMFRELTQRDGASEPLKDDFKKICEWLGTTPEDVYRDGFTREQHEQWATANEQYAREGKAPTSGLRRAFHNFAVWLGSVYRRAGALGVELSSEIRGVMDRLYSGETAVDRAEQEAPDRLFENPEEAGWTEAEYRNYADAKGLEVTEAKAQVAREMNEAALRDRTQAWREEKGNVREAVTNEIDQRPEYAAIRSLRRGKTDLGTDLTLNRDELIKQFGEERVKKLQELHRGLYRQEGGTDAETASELLGFGSGEEMMRALESTPRRAAAIEAATRDYMTAKHGDIRYDGSLDDKARLAMENDERARNLHRELAALRQKVADLQESALNSKEAAKAAKQALAPSQFPPLDAYKTAAKVFVEQKSFADLNPTRYLYASRKYARESFDAVRRGAVKQAYDAKSKELLNHYMFREASFAKEYRSKFEAEIARVVRPAAQQRLGLADAAVRRAGEVGDYRDQHNWLLARYNLARLATDANGRPVPPDRTLRAWAEDMFSQLKEPGIAPGILNETTFADYRNVPLSEIRDVHDALRNIRKLASAELQASINGKKVQLEQTAQELVSEMRANLKATPEKFFEHPMTALEKAQDIARSVDVSASRMEFLVDKAGGGLRGAWRKYIWEPYQNAKGDEYAMQADWTKRLNDQIEAESKRQGLRLSDRVMVDGIPPSETLTRKELVSIALNMGNESNYDRLQKTFEARSFDPKALSDIGGKLTADEWRFVQAIGDSLKPWGERMNAFEKEQNGLAPKMVDVKPFKVVSSDGVELNLDGWYFPVKYDPRYVLKGQEEESSKLARNLLEKGYGRAVTSRGYTKERTGSAGPLLLDYERVLTDHIAKVTKDLSHREFMQNTYRLLSHPDVRLAMRECWGPKYDQEAMSWLRATVNDRNGSVDGGADDMRYMEKVRSNLVKASLAFKASTAVLQFTHLSRLSLFTKPGSFTSAMVDFWKNPIQATEAIRELSPNVMRFRGEHLDRDYNSTLRDLTGRKDPIAAALRIGYAPMKYIDHAISFPLWRSVYNDTLLKNGPEMDVKESQTAAVQAADSAVRMGLGDASAGDLPPLMRSTDMLKKIESTLYGFENVNYNIMRHRVVGDAQRSWRAGNYAGAAGKLTFGAAMAFFVPAIMSALVRGDRPKDGENIGLWAAKRSLFFAGGTIPWVKDGVAFMEHGSLNPMASFAERTFNEAKERAREGETDWTGLGIESLQAIGDSLGVPGTDQAAHTARYVHRANQGKIENPSLYGAIVGGR